MQVKQLQVNYQKGKKLDKRGIIASAPKVQSSEKYDCISRCFYPSLLDCIEDPVTGSAHCMIVPFWGEKLNLKELLAYQASTRGGELKCEVKDNRVFLSGKAVTYLEGFIYI